MSSRWGITGQGVWTVTISDALSGGNMGSFGAQNCHYIRCGNLVVASMYATAINTSGLTAGNTAYFGGLPFASYNGTNYLAVAAVRPHYIAFTDCIVANLAGNRTAFTLVNATQGNAESAVIISDITTGSANLMATISYIAQ
jgi:hypothetical protein